jgi:hypothetical protein
MNERYVEYIGMYPEQPRLFSHLMHLQPTTPLDERDVDDPEIFSSILSRDSTSTFTMTAARSHSRLFL